MNNGKVFVIEQAELMNELAQSAMLKTLEEPAGRTLIILLTDQPDSLLATIRSRCQTVRFAALEESLVRDQLVQRGIDRDAAAHAAGIAEGSLGTAIRWLEDGVVNDAAELITQLETIESGNRADRLPHWFQKSATAYADKQIERDSLSSADQAKREALCLYLRLASQHYRRRLHTSVEHAADLERVCSAIDAIVRAETYLDANVNVPLLLQQLVVTLERLFARTAVA
jgi:hypothetical protein